MRRLSAAVTPLVIALVACLPGRGSSVPAITAIGTSSITGGA
jgi:hypothetical protein